MADTLVAPESASTAVDKNLSTDTAGTLDSEGYDVRPASDIDYSFLSTEPSTDDFDRELPIEEAMKKMAEKEEARLAKEKAEADGKGTAAADDKAGEKPAKGESAEKVSTPDEEIRKKAEIWDKFDEAFTKDPSVIAMMAFKNMTPEQKASLLKELGAAPAASAEKGARPLPDVPDDYEALSDLEVATLARWEDIKGIPALRQELAQLRESLGNPSEEVRNLREPLGYSIAQGEIALVMVEAICEAIGFDIKAPDLKAVAERLSDGRTTHRSAVRALTAEIYKKAAAEHKQSGAPRPTTPGNSSTREPKLPMGASMLDCARHVGLIP